MLYNPRWEQKVDPLSLEGLVAWLEQQPPETEYDWHDVRGGCLIGKYFKAIDAEEHQYDQVFKDCPKNYGKVCSSFSGPTTFGAALARARAILAERRQ